MPVDITQLRREVQKVYSEVVRDPKKGYHFHTGPDYAVEGFYAGTEAMARV